MGKDLVALSLLLTLPSGPPAGIGRQLVPSEEINLCPPPAGLLLWAGEQTLTERRRTGVSQGDHNLTGKLKGHFTQAQPPRRCTGVSQGEHKWTGKLKGHITQAHPPPPCFCLQRRAWFRCTEQSPHCSSQFKYSSAVGAFHFPIQFTEPLISQIYLPAPGELQGVTSSPREYLRAEMWFIIPKCLMFTICFCIKVIVFPRNIKGEIQQIARAG